MSKSDRVESGKVARDERLSAIWEQTNSRLGSKLSASQHRMLAVAVTRGAELEPSGALAGPPDQREKEKVAAMRG